MAQVVVRNLDASVVESLKLRARRRGHSLEQELRDILSAAATPTAEERLALAETIRAMTPDVCQTDSTELIRADRDR